MLYDLKDANNKTVETYTCAQTNIQKQTTCTHTDNLSYTQPTAKWEKSYHRAKMNKLDKTQEGQTLLDDGNNYTPLEDPMARAKSLKKK